MALAGGGERLLAILERERGVERWRVGRKLECLVTAVTSLSGSEARSLCNTPNS